MTITAAALVGYPPLHREPLGTASLAFCAVAVAPHFRSWAFAAGMTGHAALLLTP